MECSHNRTPAMPDDLLCRVLGMPLPRRQALGALLWSSRPAEHVQSISRGSSRSASASTAMDAAARESAPDSSFLEYYCDSRAHLTEEQHCWLVLLQLILDLCQGQRGASWHLCIDHLSCKSHPPYLHLEAWLLCRTALPDLRGPHCELCQAYCLPQ